MNNIFNKTGLYGQHDVSNRFEMIHNISNSFLTRTLTNVFMESLVLDDGYVDNYYNDIKAVAMSRFKKLISEGYIKTTDKSTNFIIECEDVYKTLSSKYSKLMNEDITDAEGIYQTTIKYDEFVKNEAMDIPDVIYEKVVKVVLDEMKDMSIDYISESLEDISDAVKTEILVRRSNPSLFENISYSVTAATTGDNVLDVFNETCLIYTIYETCNTLNVLKEGVELTSDIHNTMASIKLVDIDTLIENYNLGEYVDDFKIGVTEMLNEANTPGKIMSIEEDIKRIRTSMENGTHLYNTKIVDPIGWTLEFYNTTIDNDLDDSINLLEGILEQIEIKKNQLLAQ